MKPFHFQFLGISNSVPFYYSGAAKFYFFFYVANHLQNQLFAGHRLNNKQLNDDLLLNITARSNKGPMRKPMVSDII